MEWQIKPENLLTMFICQSKCSLNVAFTVANAKTALTLTNLAQNSCIHRVAMVR